jgi:hypothetical protein
MYLGGRVEKSVCGESGEFCVETPTRGLESASGWTLWTARVLGLRIVNVLFMLLVIVFILEIKESQVHIKFAPSREGEGESTRRSVN